MKKFVWVLVFGMLYATFTLMGCKSDDVEKDRITGAEVLRIEDIIDSPSSKNR